MIDYQNNQISKTEKNLKPELFIQSFLKIRTKDGKLIDFNFNKVQIEILNKIQEGINQGFRKFLFLKSRETGLTTLFQALNFYLVIAEKFNHVITLAHDYESAEKIFQISQLFYTEFKYRNILPKRLTAHNKKDLNFPSNNSLFSIGTAGSRGYGRGLNIQQIHLSELAHFKIDKTEIDNLMSGLFQACSSGLIFGETTANGFDNWFYDSWLNAKNKKNDWYPVFIAWYQDDKNTIPLSANEKLELTENEIEKLKRYNLSLEQIKFYRKAKKAHGKLVDQEYPYDDITAFLTTQINFFITEIIKDLIPYCNQPIYELENGNIKVWKEPEQNHRYCIGADTSEGIQGGDYSAAGILDIETCEQVVSIHGYYRPEMFARKLAEYGLKYNQAIIAPERNNHGHSVINSLMNQLCYENIYQHKSYDSYSDSFKWGFETNAKTRPQMLDGLAEALHNKLMKVNDYEFLRECLQFQYDGKQSIHDDRIFAWGIAWLVRQDYLIEPKIIAL